MPLYEGLSYGGEKTTVVIDFGAAFTKCGFAGENGPRCIIPSEVLRPKTGKVVKIRDHFDKEDLYEVLVDFIHILYFRHFLVNHKERRVVVVESLLTPSHVRNTLAKVLFQHFEVPSLAFAPAHVVSLFTLGVQSSLVIDVGYSETFILPVYEGFPILKAWQAVPLAGKAIHKQIEKQLIEGGRVQTPTREEKPLSDIMDSLDESILEDIKVRCCFVTNFKRAQEITASKSEQGASQAPEPPPGVDFPLGTGNILHVTGEVRERSCEILFEQDNEEVSLATLVLDAIEKCPIDTRKTLAENIMVIGGTGMLPGFKHRLMAELKDLLNKPKYAERLAIKVIKIHKPPAKENYTAWLGGAILGALDILPSRSISREAYQQHSKIPDWSGLDNEQWDGMEDKNVTYYKR